MFCIQASRLIVRLSLTLFSNLGVAKTSCGQSALSDSGGTDPGSGTLVSTSASVTASLCSPGWSGSLSRGSQSGSLALGEILTAHLHKGFARGHFRIRYSTSLICSITRYRPSNGSCSLGLRSFFLWGLCSHTSSPLFYRVCLTGRPLFCRTLEILRCSRANWWTLSNRSPNFWACSVVSLWFRFTKQQTDQRAALSLALASYHWVWTHELRIGTPSWAGVGTSPSHSGSSLQTWRTCPPLSL